MDPSAPRTDCDATGTADPATGPATTFTQGDPAPGRGPARFGKYELLDLIGDGGMGIVWRARHHETNGIVALKTLKSAADAPATLIERFRTEARAAARLRHPHVVPVNHFDRDDGQPYFTMPYLPDGSLARHKERFRKPARAARPVEQVARGVHHAHEHGVQVQLRPFTSKEVVCSPVENIE
ncbi:MAG: protein kinase domain-containing protein [Gemmataceae bacterium]